MHSMPVTTVAAAILASKRWENLSGKVAESAWSTETEKRNQLSKQETVSGMEKGKRQMSRALFTTQKMTQK